MIQEAVKKDIQEHCVIANIKRVIDLQNMTKKLLKLTSKNSLMVNM